MTQPVIQVEGLTKTYRSYKKKPGFKGAVRGLFKREYENIDAAKNVSFQVAQGELVGFLGPNGAGKTTTLKMLAGLLFPTSGTANVLGYVPWQRQDGYRRQFALLLGQKNQLWWDLPARESLELNARIYGISKEKFEKTVDELTALLAGSRQAQHHGARTLAWRAHEDGTDRFTPARTENPLPRRANDRPRRDFTKNRS
jgi:ABC-2 type transport system ATP-binding protein